MQVSQNMRIFNNFYASHSKNSSLFDNLLKDMSHVEHVSEVKDRRLQEKVVTSEYHNMVKFKQATYIEVNSAALLSLKSSIQNRVTPVDVKRVNSILAYSA